MFWKNRSCRAVDEETLLLNKEIKISHRNTKKNCLLWKDTLDFCPTIWNSRKWIWRKHKQDRSSNKINWSTWSFFKNCFLHWYPVVQWQRLAKVDKLIHFIDSWKKAVVIALFFPADLCFNRGCHCLWNELWNHLFHSVTDEWVGLFSLILTKLMWPCNWISQYWTGWRELCNNRRNFFIQHRH